MTDNSPANKLRLIRLLFDAEGLFKSDPPDAKDFCKIANGPDSPWAKASRNFISHVISGGTIRWQGQLKGSQASRFILHMDKVIMEVPGGGQSKILTRNEFAGSNHSIEAQVLPIVDLSVEENYNIVFTLTDKDAKQSKKFKLDPILKGDTDAQTAYLQNMQNCLSEPIPSGFEDPVLVRKVEDLKAYVDDLLAHFGLNSGEKD